VQVSGIAANASKISAGANHTCVVVSAAAKCWGSGASGQLGNGSTANSLVPVSVTGLGSGVTRIDSGASFTTAVTTGGAVRAWGDNTSGQVSIKPGATWTRFIIDIDGDMAATLDSDGQYSYTISNVRGDIVATVGASGVAQTNVSDEFGNPTTDIQPNARYSFLGDKQRESLTAGGTVAMGVRLYVPGAGRFLQVDPVLGGNESPYTYPTDPISSFDLDGKKAAGAGFCMAHKFKKPKVIKKGRAKKPYVQGQGGFICGGWSDPIKVEITVTMQYREPGSDVWHTEYITVRTKTVTLPSGSGSKTLKATMRCKKGEYDYRVKVGVFVQPPPNSVGNFSEYWESDWVTLKCYR
jgi:RHS repeat-associated protein